MRVPINAVWETAVFVLNILAFVLIGMQLRPIWDRLDLSTREAYLLVALAVLATAIAVRFAWVMGYNTVRRLLPAELDRRTGRPLPKPTLKGSIIVSWAGMRGIVTLATAFALPETLADGSPFPYRDLILLTAFAVVFGTLVIQGLTLKPLIALLGFQAEDPVADEVKWARGEAYRAALAAIEGDTSHDAALLRKEYGAAIELSTSSQGGRLEDQPGNAIRRAAIVAARNKANDLRLKGAIGDPAYRALESEFDWAELSAGSGAFK
jgi:CPA1 family monovalent cation:H+ antiporter